MPPGINRAAIRVANGSYVCAENGGNGRLVANRPAIGPWEIFDFTWLSDDTVALKAVNGRYVHLSAGGDEATVPGFPSVFLGENTLWAIAADILRSTVFRVLWHPDDRVSFQGWTGSYVCAESGGGGELIANRPAVGEWEKFQLEVPPTV